MGAWPPRGRPVANAPRGPGDRSASGEVHQIAAAVSPHVGSTRAGRPVAARQARGPVVVRSGRNPSAGSDAMPASPSVVIVAAVARNGVIGSAGDMPWHLPADLKRFKAITLGKPMLPGSSEESRVGKAWVSA